MQRLDRDLGDARRAVEVEHFQLLQLLQFQESFVGKRVLDSGGEIASVTVVKGRAADRFPDALEHHVDGVSGATITSDGVTEMIREALDRYEPYFGKIRGQG